jgi:hypothetical protein
MAVFVPSSVNHAFLLDRNLERLRYGCRFNNLPAEEKQKKTENRIPGTTVSERRARATEPHEDEAVRRYDPDAV